MNKSTKNQNYLLLYKSKENQKLNLDKSNKFKV